MNLFKVLSGGNSSIREVNMTAILGYFLDEYQDHALGNQLLLELISIIDHPNNILEDYTRSETLIESENIDTVIKFFKPEGDKQKEFHRIIIENKIQNSAADASQLVRYYNSQRKVVDENVSITVLFITHENPSRKTLDEFNNLGILREGDSKKHIFWYKSNNKNSIHQLLLNLITKEYRAEIDPIHGYILQTIKAFVRHLESFSNTYKVSVPSDELERRERYGIVRQLRKKQKKLGGFLFRDREISSDEVDSVSDLRHPRFCYSLPETNLKICLQYSNRESPQVRILLRPEVNDSTGRKRVRELCDAVNTKHEVLVYKINGTYAHLVKNDDDKLVDTASKKLPAWEKEEDGMKNTIKRYIDIVQPNNQENL